jgi:hypothetical protein
MSVVIDGTTGITTPGLTNTGTETIVNLTTTGNTILGDASTDTLNVGNGGLVKDASGNVGIGTASPSGKLHVAGSSGQLRISGSGYVVNPAELTLGQYDTTVGYIQTPGGSTGRVEVWNGVTSAIAVFNQYGMGLGTVPTSGTGITFPATQSASSNANTLDDYEEGTFTPAVYGGTTAGTTTFSDRNGFYTKIGRQVIVVIRVSYTSLTGTGLMIIGSLPFSSSTSASLETAGTLMVQGLNWSGGTYLTTYMGQNSTELNIYGSADDASVTAQACVNESAVLWITHTYFSA